MIVHVATTSRCCGVALSAWVTCDQTAPPGYWPILEPLLTESFEHYISGYLACNAEALTSTHEDLKLKQQKQTYLVLTHWEGYTNVNGEMVALIQSIETLLQQTRVGSWCFLNRQWWRNMIFPWRSLFWDIVFCLQPGWSALVIYCTVFWAIVRCLQEFMSPWYAQYYTFFYWCSLSWIMKFWRAGRSCHCSLGKAWPDTSPSLERLDMALMQGMQFNPSWYLWMLGFGYLSQVMASIQTNQRSNVQ